MTIFELTLYFLFGLAVGSFSNVCIYRLPLKQSIILPRSHCPECKTPLPYYYNIPLLSYLYLQLLVFIFIGGLIVFYHYVRKIEAMGLGDLKLFITLGFLFGLHGILFILILSSLSGAVLGSITLWRNKKNFTTQIPFGPYIIVATFIYILVGPQVIAKTEKIAMYYLYNL